MFTIHKTGLVTIGPLSLTLPNTFVTFYEFSGQPAAVRPRALSTATDCPTTRNPLPMTSEDDHQNIYETNNYSHESRYCAKTTYPPFPHRPVGILHVECLLFKRLTCVCLLVQILKLFHICRNGIGTNTKLHYQDTRNTTVSNTPTRNTEATGGGFLVQRQQRETATQINTDSTLI